MESRLTIPWLAVIALAGCAAAPAEPQSAPAPPAPGASEPQVPAAMQWLYGSGEGAAASVQTYRAFAAHVLAAVRTRPSESVILENGSTLAEPRFVPCGGKPLAVVLDVDETAIQNLGFEHDEARRGRSDRDALRRSHLTAAAAVAPMPGAVEAVRAARAAGVTAIFVSNRLVEASSGTEAALANAGLGPARSGETLFLKTDEASGSGKDERRTAIAQRYCVVAMAGDQLGDFSDLFNVRGLAVRDRRRAASEGRLAAMWGAGWFMLSNPVYGPSIRGSFDEVFPPELRWNDPTRPR
ncbi:HAD family acid phosphatase [Allosphingosinicella sp.]|uniref:HAD family acid phosphatase n=1 Tax=Allosphingosinicella sp. TaxID=2823234 RepID=UPI002F002811